MRKSRAWLINLNDVLPVGRSKDERAPLSEKSLVNVLTAFNGDAILAFEIDGTRSELSDELIAWNT
jgi:hypothetical protein